MTIQTPANQPDDSHSNEPARTLARSALTPGQILAVLGLGLAALAVLGFSGGTLNVTSTGVTMAVNART